ncbi:Gfo/Idh/MocA family protein [Paenibacillus alkalitolerans]|uniref:Gfo/Idh/MocA family protein n=1 Tax=Paenibacillus alkalitolerans TaxID=2799335 RepID=UPI0018F64C36|nr:Gfo/Idh/MocA family oxidoreductase [Paenibacillus alkalitolerans]
MDKKLRIGIIGGGGIARGAHIANYFKYPDKAEVVAVADVNEDVLQLNRQEFGIEHTFTHYRDMLAKMELDAVSVCTPNKFHAGAAIAALEAGCNVLCEKPPAMNAAEAREMANAARKSGKLLHYGFHFRFSAEAQMLRRYIDAGELGHVYSGKIKALRRSGIPGWGVFTNKELQGGGPLIDIGVHMLDLGLYFMGYPKPVHVIGKTYRELGNRPLTPTWGGQWDYENYSVEDLAMAMITFDNGASLHLEASFIVHMKENDRMNVQLYGTEGGCSFSPVGIYKDRHGTLIDIAPAYLPKVDAYHAEIGAFLNACRGEPTPLSTPEEGILVQQIVDAIYASADSGKPVTV